MSLLFIFAPAALVGAILDYTRSPAARRKARELNRRAHNLVHDITYPDPRRRAKRTFY